MTIIFLREGNISLDSRALKEINTLSEHFEVVIYGMNDFGLEQEYYDYGSKKFFHKSIELNWSSRVGHIIAFLKYYIYSFNLIRKNRKKIEFIWAVNLWLGLVAYMSKKFFKIRYVYDIYDSLAYTRNYPRLIKKILIFLEKIVVNGSETTILVSESRKAQIGKSSPKNIEVIYNSPDLNVESKQTVVQKEADIFRIVYVGGLSPYRAIPELLQSVSELDKYELIIGGEGRLKKLVEEYSNKYKNIHYLGRLKYEDVLSLEKTADALTALYDPSIENHKFASPNKFFEGFALGKPLLMFRNTGMDSWIVKEDAGVVIDTSDKESIKNGLRKIKEQYSTDTKIEDRMKKVFAEKFSWSIMERKIHNITERIEKIDK